MQLPEKYIENFDISSVAYWFILLVYCYLYGENLTEKIVPPKYYLPRNMFCLFFPSRSDSLIKNSRPLGNELFNVEMTQPRAWATYAKEFSKVWEN